MKIKILSVISIVFALGVLGWFTPTGRLLIMGALYEINSDWFLKDEFITQGDWQGIGIGDSKDIVMVKLMSRSGGALYIDERYYKEGRIGTLVLLDKNNGKFILESSNEWKIYFSERSSDYVVFNFKNGVLFSIQRYMKNLEFP